MTVQYLHRQTPELLPGHHIVRLSGGRQIEVLIEGNSQNKVMFCHGLGGSPRFFRMLKLATEIYDVQIVSFWVPNHGRSSDVIDYYELVDLIVELHSELGLGQVPWMGHSLGGFLSAALAIEHPELVSAFVAMAAPIGPPYDVRPLPKRLLAPRLAYLAAENLGPVQWALLAQAALHGRLPHALAAEADLLIHRPRLLKTIRLLDTAPVIIDRLASLGIPMGHVYGEFDPVVRPCYGLPGEEKIIKKGLHSFPLTLGDSGLRDLLNFSAPYLGIQPSSETATVLAFPGVALA